MKCKCAEESHLHFGYCDSEITFADSTPMNDYKEERKYGRNDKGEQIVIDRLTVDYDKERCCNECYDKIKNEEILKLKKYMLGNPKVDEDTEITKDDKMRLKEAFKGCEICGESVEAPKREDEINICDKCNDKYP